MGNIIGIDASLSSTGYCVLNLADTSIIEVDKIVTKSKQLQGERLCIIGKAINEVVKKYNIQKLIVEEPFTGRNKKTSNKLQRVIGILESIAYENNIEFKEVPPKSIRASLMDNGSATKEEVAEFISRMFKDSPIVTKLGPLNDKACKDKNSDMYDAIAVAASEI